MNHQPPLKPLPPTPPRPLSVPALCSLKQPEKTKKKYKQKIRLYPVLFYIDWSYLQRKTIERKSVSVCMFLCVLVHKRKNDKKEVICRFSVFCVCSYKKRKKIKRKSIFVFPFFCFLVHKRKNDKTEVIFCFSFFCVCWYIKGKTIKRKSFFVFPFFVFVGT